jgi:hypothetical protein
MKRAFSVVLISAAGVALLGALVYSVLVVARVAEPAGTTVHGLTLRRAWATASAGLALVAAIGGGLARARAAPGVGKAGRAGAMAIAAGSCAAVSGLLNLATARGGPGSGNGVVGGAAALVLGILAVALGARALARNRIKVERTR